MEFKKSKYYDKKFLGKYLYGKIVDKDEIFKIQEFFNINDSQKEYLKEWKNTDNMYCNYKLVVYEDYYELDSQYCDGYVYLVFDKPVHIIGEHCINIVAPKITIKNKGNDELYYCVTNKVVIDNGNEYNYKINNSKVNNLYFHNSRIYFWKSEINNFFIFNKDLYLLKDSKFLNYHKIKCFGKCDDLKKKILKDENFQKGIIHIE